jgi:hypothetical protein
MTVEELSQRVGWEMAEPLRDSQRFRAYTLDALIDLCAEVDVDWRETLTDATG